MFNRTATATTRAVNRQNVPRALQLPQAHRLSGLSPQSPLRDSAFFQVSGKPTPSPTATSPSPLFASCSPLTQSARMEKLTYCVASSVPAELAFPSLGQVASDAADITSILDLYYARAYDDAALARVKSPTSYDPTSAAAAQPWAPLAVPAAAVPRRRRGTLRRSRSLSDMKHGIATTSDAAHGPARMARAAAPAEQPTTRPRPTAPTAAAQRTIVTSDARRMASFRRRLAACPAAFDARTPPPDAPLPSPPPPSALLKVKSPPPPALRAPRAAVASKAAAHAALMTSAADVALAARPRPRPHVGPRSPRAPYWVKPARTKTPKTPRTMRSERRQGWGGVWNVGSIGMAVDRLREAEVQAAR